MSSKAKIHLIAGARPNFMKIAPLWKALAAHGGFTTRFVHTGQHYDPALSDQILRDLGLPDPDFSLGVGSASHAAQTGSTMIRYDEVLNEDPADLVVVVGDVNSTLAAALVAVKRGVKVAHLEAGLRCGDRTMPEEINRIATDAICDHLWTPSPDADENLAAEGIPADKIARVGNIMIDSLEMVRHVLPQSTILDRLALRAGEYGLVTLHRPFNVDQQADMVPILTALRGVSRHLPLILPAHPRIRQALQSSETRPLLEGSQVTIIDAQGYIDFMRLLSCARLVMTDSGGVQEETSYLGIPCLTLRPSTERPITLSLGTNQLSNPAKLEDDATQILARPRPRIPTIPLWDGSTAQRVIRAIETMP